MLKVIFYFTLPFSLLGFFITMIFLGIVWDNENPLEDTEVFFFSVFFCQITFWAATNEKINLFGEIILQILIAPFTIPISLLVFAALLIGEFFYTLWRIFMFMFRKKKVN